MIFISHANEPRDNEFTRWLALRLAGLGYPVWCDQTKLLGGEKSWDNIENAIRDASEKVLVVLSRDSNSRESVLREVTDAGRVGKTRNDFIIPLRIDDLAHDEITIELSRLDAIDFSKSWAPALAQLLKKLEEDALQKDEARFNHDAVASWWRDNERQLAEVSTTPETCASNWFRISDMPEHLYLHSLVDPLKKDGAKQLDLGVPNYQKGGGIFSFESPKAMARRLKEYNMVLAESVELGLSEFQQTGYRGLRLAKAEARNIVTALLNQAFDLRCRAAGLRHYEMSGAKSCFWFPPGFTEGDKVYFTAISSRPRRGKPNRRMVGIEIGRNGLPKKRRWHFGISAKLIRWPQLAFAIRSHVIFTDPEGELLAAAKQHKARRSECKSWFNDVWLDRMLAALSFLHDPDYAGFISVPCGDDVGFTVSTRPLCFQSPIRFGESKAPSEMEAPDTGNDDTPPTNAEELDDSKDLDDDEDEDQDEDEEEDA